MCHGVVLQVGARGPSRRTVVGFETITSQHFVSRGAGPTTELYPTPSCELATSNYHKRNTFHLPLHRLKKRLNLLTVPLIKEHGSQSGRFGFIGLWCYISMLGLKSSCFKRFIVKSQL